MPRRSASRPGRAIEVAPVSTRKRTGLPLIAPSVTKWPRVSAERMTCCRSLLGAPVVLAVQQHALLAVDLHGRAVLLHRKHRDAVPLLADLDRLGVAAIH